MGPRGGSSIGAFLMSLPVSAILLMAVFGIPRFDPGTAGESGWQSARQLFDNFRNGGANDPRSPEHPNGFQNGRPGETDPFASTEAPTWQAAPSHESSSTNDWRSSFASNRDAGLSSEAPRSGEVDDHPLTRPRDDQRRESPSAAGMTWTDARRRLADLGVDRFHLEAGLAPDQFLFVCLFSPAGDSQVTQRFEAEASDPLVAVEQVLGQIERWSSQRYAEDSQSRLTPNRQ